MSARLQFVLSFAAALALAVQPALAKDSHGGGGGRSGGGHASASAGHSGAVRSAPQARAATAVPRVGGGISELRHPRAGTGRYYRPYYGGSRYPRYGGYYGGSLYLGWPYYWGGYYYGPGYYSYYPYSYPGYYAPYYDYGYAYGPPASYAYGDDSAEASVDPGDRTRGVREAAPPPRESAERDPGRLRLDVRPDDATVYVDDEFRGTARELHSLLLPPGRHLVELVRPGFATERREVTVEEGETASLRVDLQRR